MAVLEFPDPSVPPVVFDCGGSAEFAKPAKKRLDAILGGSKTVSALFLSHLDDDHVRFAQSLFCDVKITDGVIRGVLHHDKKEDMKKLQKKAEALEKLGFAVIEATEKQVWSYGRTQISVLSGYAKVSNEPNDNSLVLRVDHGLFSEIFPGDITSYAEEGLKTLEPCTVLVAAHHGSAESSSGAFLAKTRPSVVVFSGNRQSYSHPSVSAVQRALKHAKHGWSHDVVSRCSQTPYIEAALRASADDVKKIRESKPPPALDPRKLRDSKWEAWSDYGTDVSLWESAWSGGDKRPKVYHTYRGRSDQLTFTTESSGCITLSVCDDGVCFATELGDSVPAGFCLPLQKKKEEDVDPSTGAPRTKIDVK